MTLPLFYSIHNRASASTWTIPKWNWTKHWYDNSATKWFDS